LVWEQHSYCMSQYFFFQSSLLHFESPSCVIPTSNVSHHLI
jgi:hypothetical protein